MSKGLLGQVPNRWATNALSDTSPELVVGFRANKNTTWFVDSAAAAGGNGASWSGAVTTLVAALALAVAGDTILMAPGHTETTIAAGTVTISKAVTIIGLGVGRNRPTVNFTTATAANVLISGNNVRIVNVVFTPTGIDAVAAALSITGTDCELVGCDFQLATAAAQATYGILTTSAADRLTVAECRFYGTTDAGTTAAIGIVGGDGHIIRDCIFSGAYSSGVGAIQQLTTTTTNCIVEGNRIQNFTASCTKAMVFTSSSTGQISRNDMTILSGTAPITGAAMSWVGGNYYAAAVATAGTLI